MVVISSPLSSFHLLWTRAFGSDQLNLFAAGHAVPTPAEPSGSIVQNASPVAPGLSRQSLVRSVLDEQPAAQRRVWSFWAADWAQRWGSPLAATCVSPPWAW